MWTSGNGTWPKNARRASHSRTVLSFPMDHSMASCLNALYASRRMWLLRFSSWSRWSTGRSVLPFQPGQHPSARRVGRDVAGVDDDLGPCRRLVRIVDPREAQDLAPPGARVESLHVAVLALLERGRHIHLDEAL